MSKPIKARRYAPLWAQLQHDYKVSVQLQPIHMSVVQAERAYKGFKRAISKEKYEDIIYRNANPLSLLRYDFDPDTYIVTITLYPKGYSPLEIL